VDRGEPWAVALQLRTQSRERGYVESVDFNFILSRAGQELAEDKGLTFEEVMAEANEILAARSRVERALLRACFTHDKRDYQA
jgi:hypothetical protein